MQHHSYPQANDGVGADGIEQLIYQLEEWREFGLPFADML